MNSISGSMRKKIKNWLQGSLGCGLFLEKWDWERLLLRAHGPHTPVLLASGGMWAMPSKKVGPILGTDQHLLTLHSNYSALQGLSFME